MTWPGIASPEAPARAFGLEGWATEVHFWLRTLNVLLGRKPALETCRGLIGFSQCRSVSRPLGLPA